MEGEIKLQEINKQAAINASKALSKLINRPVGVEISKTEVKKIENLKPLIGLEDIVAGIYLPVTGDIKGAALLIFPKEAAFNLSDLLVRREPGTTRKLTELDESALKEVGNIISGNYLTVLSNMLQLKIVEHIPQFSFDMFGAIVSQIITDFTCRTEKALVIEIEFTFKPVTLKGYFILLFEIEQFKAILGEPTVMVMMKRAQELIGEDYGFMKATKLSNGNLLMDGVDKVSKDVSLEKLTLAFRDYVYTFLHLVRMLTSDVLVEQSQSTTS